MAQTTPRNVRLETETRQQLGEASGDRGVPQATLMAECIREGLAMRAHPGITFHDGPSGRRASLEGGPDVWEIAARVEELRDDHDPDEVTSALAEEFGTPARMVEVALRYWAAHVDEITERIARNDVARTQVAEQLETRHGLLSSAP